MSSPPIHIFHLLCSILLIKFGLEFVHEFTLLLTAGIRAFLSGFGLVRGVGVLARSRAAGGGAGVLIGVLFDLIYFTI